MPQTANPAEAGSVLARNRLLLAAREAETGEAEAEKGKRGWFGYGAMAVAKRQ